MKKLSKIKLKEMNTMSYSEMKNVIGGQTYNSGGYGAGLYVFRCGCMGAKDDELFNVYAPSPQVALEITLGRCQDGGGGCFM